MQKKNKPNNKFSLKNQRLYPHFKLTNEKFPRLLVTRKIADDGAEYFGAFLPETLVRFLIDFLNKTFRLRACEIDVDGSFDVPCPQFYRKRCVAPCVVSLCDKKSYDEQAELVRLFLRRDTEELKKYFKSKIEKFSEDLDFESAKEIHETQKIIEKIFNEKDWNFRLDDAVDTFEVTKNESAIYVNLVTMRARKNLGKRTFIFENSKSVEEVLSAILPQFYRFYVPKEIRVSHDFADRFLIADELSKKFKRKIKISVFNENQPKVLTDRAIERAKFDYEFRQIKPEKSLTEIQTEFKKVFNLRRRARRIEGFDVAHISATDFVAAKSVWIDGRIVGGEFEFWFSNEKSELETLRKFVEFRFSQDAENFPDLILIDGGKSHLQATLKAVEKVPNRSFQIVSAVKPVREHNRIAKFLTEAGKLVEFDNKKHPHQILQIVRDEAHEFSNQIHRQRREFSHFYELAEILPSLNEAERRKVLKFSNSIKNISELTEKDLEKVLPKGKLKSVLKDLENYRNGKSKKVEPLIVPLRFADENGDAEDLRPIANYRVK